MTGLRAASGHLTRLTAVLRGLHAAKATGLAAHIAHATYPGRAEGDVGLRGAEIPAHPGAAAEVIAKFKNTKY